MATLTLTISGVSPQDIVPSGLPVYRVVIAALNGYELDEVPANDLQFSYILDASGSVDFTLPLRHTKSTHSLLKEGQRAIHVYRDSIRVWGGYLWDINASQDQIRVSGQGWFSRLLRTYISADLVYTATEQFDIAWNLIAYIQAQVGGDFGITRKTVSSSGITRDRTYNSWELKNTGEALQELAAVENGFDFEITPYREWVPYYPSKGSDQGAIFELGKNIGGMSWRLSAADVSSEVTAVGSGSETSTLLSVAQDADALGAYGLLQTSTAYVDVTVQATLDDHAAADVGLLKKPADQPQFQLETNDPPFGSYTVGDAAHVKAQDGFIDIDRDYRITSITVALSNEGKENIGLFFDEVVV